MICFLLGLKSYSQETRVDSENPVTYKSAEFPGGDSAFSKEFLKMIHAYIDLGLYAVNGKFVFTFDVDENGKVINLKVLPKVKNSEMFIEDMQFAMKKVKKKWKPAVRNGKPVLSQKIISIYFTSDYFDHGD
ncbi:energy transducer TonB [Chryseobacterium binzhouense]|uniref:energy transducer TonB n=1 Tax=Chryseobacterium binzhouense TaxID=2593646 RepID=UPI00289EFD2F|nr:energy transducer TonB [Chryseobacterium binzhouense]